MLDVFKPCRGLLLYSSILSSRERLPTLWIPLAEIYPLELMLPEAVMGWVNVVMPLIVKGLAPDNSENEPDKPITVPLELMFDPVLGYN